MNSSPSGLPKHFQRLYSGSWCVGIRRRATIPQPIGLVDSYHWLRAPAGHYYADPFVVEHRGTTFVFVEDFSYYRGYATLTALELDAAFNVTSRATVLDLKTHLSYPHVFQINGQHYLIPEGTRQHGVVLYEAVDFPWRWRPVCILLKETTAVDTTLFHEGGLYWLFTTIVKQRYQYDNVHLFFSPALDGPFIAHPKNPVESDPRCCRAAGRIFRDGSTLVRPAQDCADWYGQRVRLRIIERLSTTDYAELDGVGVEPLGKNVFTGLHTYNRSETYEVIDVGTHRVTLFGCLGKVTGRVRRLAESVMPQIELVAHQEGRGSGEN